MRIVVAVAVVSIIVVIGLFIIQVVADVHVGDDNRRWCQAQGGHVESTNHGTYLCLTSDGRVLRTW